MRGPPARAGHELGPPELPFLQRLRLARGPAVAGPGPRERASLPASRAGCALLPPRPQSAERVAEGGFGAAVVLRRAARIAGTRGRQPRVQLAGGSDQCLEL